MQTFVRLPGGSLLACESKEVSSVLIAQFGTTFWLDWHGPSACAVRLRLPGGKGGFGSQLRAQGNRMSSKKRAGGYEACRDLSGRRLRTINQSRAIADYLKKKPEMDRQREAEIRDKMLKAIEAPDRKPVFNDLDYLRVARESIDDIELAVHEVFGEDLLLLDEIEQDDKGKGPM